MVDVGCWILDVDGAKLDLSRRRVFVESGNVWPDFSTFNCWEQLRKVCNLADVNRAFLPQQEWRKSCLSDDVVLTLDSPSPPGWRKHLSLSLGLTLIGWDGTNEIEWRHMPNRSDLFVQIFNLEIFNLEAFLPTGLLLAFMTWWRETQVYHLFVNHHQTTLQGSFATVRYM